MTLQELKQRAARRGAELLVLRPGGKLPEAMRGNTGKELWLCVQTSTDKKLIYAAASRFDQVYIFNKTENKNEVSK
ncbi:MAG: hypothetical protein E7041_07895 [Lentisphaerae bacterium]|nr:hypothetical protein [Lentisphaerota bacterium]